MVTGQSLYFL
ncbi:rCG37064, partial [Rattus norvegicus]